jgi:NADPH:quinone reductase
MNSRADGSGCSTKYESLFINFPFLIYHRPMKAVVIGKYGGIEGLEIRDVPEPSLPGDDYVRVRVRAASLNRADILQRMGRYPAPEGFPQDIPGLEFAGEVESIGKQVTKWRLGQRVFGITAGGAQAEYVVVPEKTLAEIPDNLDWIGAAAVPEVFITAHDALFTQANLVADETVLVHAAGSGVGTAAIQLARAAGAHPFGTSRTSDKLKRAREFGLEDSVTVADDPQAFVEAVRTWTGGKGVNVVLDLVGASYFEANLEALALKGRMMLVGTSGGSKASFGFSTVMDKQLTIRGTVLRSRTWEEKAAATHLFAVQVVPLLANGSVRPVVDRVYRLDEIRQAHQRLESNQSFGKVVLVIE